MGCLAHDSGRRKRLLRVSHVAGLQGQLLEVMIGADNVA
jgi:hypothetical protein